MNSLSYTLRVMLFGSLPSMASAAVITHTWNSDFVGTGNVPDGNPLGWSDTRNLSGITTTTLTDVNVSLSLSGGYNGDLFVYLQHDSGIAILLNPPRSHTGSSGNLGHHEIQQEGGGASCVPFARRNSAGGVPIRLFPGP